jgi:E3 ubiquitin-protein ligase RNF14
MGDIAYCPRANCGSAVVSEGEGEMGRCPQCFFSFCTLCRESYHPGVLCMTVEAKLRLLRARREGAEGLNREEAEKLRMQEVALVEEMRSM